MHFVPFQASICLVYKANRRVSRVDFDLLFDPGGFFSDLSHYKLFSRSSFRPLAGPSRARKRSEGRARERRYGSEEGIVTSLLRRDVISSKTTDKSKSIINKVLAIVTSLQKKRCHDC